VRAAFGSWDAVNQVRMIRDIFALAPKGSSKTSYSAALMLVVDADETGRAPRRCLSGRRKRSPIAPMSRRSA
jgi:hypothetical protein